ncbi:MAG: helicase HerA-like domain-containing protein [Candidatus Eisenbacteria bacterium]
MANPSDASAEAFARTILEGFRFAGAPVPLGGAMHAGECHPELKVAAALALMNRHGLVAGATGTGKTKTLQGMAEQLSAVGVPVFLADLKGDLSGLATPGEASPKVAERAQSLGISFRPQGFPVEFLSLTGKRGAAMRATVADFGPLLLAKALDLNDTQASVLALVFKFADDQQLPLLDLADLRAVVSWLAGDDPPDLSQYGGLSKSTAGVLVRKLTELELQGAGEFFGEPAFDVHDLLRTASDGRGVISILELSDVQDRPRLFSTFLMWLLAELYEELPERGDTDKPLLVFFFDEAHYLFDDASKALTEQITQVVRLIRSKGVGIFFVTQTPSDVPSPVLEQLGNRIQHALRAFTPNDAKALKATVSTFPTTPFYDLAETLTTLAIGEAVVSVLAESGSPAPVVATRMLPPASRMAPLSDAEFASAIAGSPLATKLAQAIDRESARELLAARTGRGETTSAPAGSAPAPDPPHGKAAPTTGAAVVAAAGSILGGLLKFATSRRGQTLIRGVLGTPTRRRR